MAWNYEYDAIKKEYIRVVEDKIQQSKQLILFLKSCNFNNYLQSTQDVKSTRKIRIEK